MQGVRVEVAIQDKMWQGATWQGAMAVRQASMIAGGPKGSVTAPLGVPDRAEPGARNWEGSGWGGMIDWTLGGALNWQFRVKGCSTTTSKPAACSAASPASCTGKSHLFCLKTQREFWLQHVHRGITRTAHYQEEEERSVTSHSIAQIPEAHEGGKPGKKGGDQGEEGGEERGG